MSKRPNVYGRRLPKGRIGVLTTIALALVPSIRSHPAFHVMVGRGTARDQPHVTCDSLRPKRKADSERCANRICLACRKVRHSAKDCPSILVQPHTHGTGDGAPRAKNLTGICYRCASNFDRGSYTRHTLMPVLRQVRLSKAKSPAVSPATAARRVFALRVVHRVLLTGSSRPHSDSHERVSQK